MECPDCRGYLTGRAHFRRHHQGSLPLRLCTLCRFQSASLADTLLHCLLNGHSPACLATEYPQEIGSQSNQGSQSDNTEDQYGKPAGNEALNCMPEASEATKLDVSAEISDISSDLETQLTEDTAGEEAFDFALSPNEASTESADGAEKYWPSVGRISLSCRKCQAQLNPSLVGAKQSAQKHVMGCLDIKPYVCSHCKRQFAWRQGCVNHLKRSSGRICSESKAATVLVNKEENVRRIRDGLLQCFPEFSASIKKVAIPFRAKMVQAGNVANATENGDTFDEKLSTQTSGGNALLPRESGSDKKNAHLQKSKDGNKDSEERVPLVCGRCSSILRPARANVNKSVREHSISCLGLRPFACSACGFQSAARTGVMQHVKSMRGAVCAEAKATAVFVKREEDEQRIREAMKLCFPDWSYDWKGF